MARGMGEERRGATGFGRGGGRMRAKGKKAGGFPSGFLRLGQALLAPGSIPRLRIALLVLGVPFAQPH